jgi:hypothetical protein
LDTFAIPRIYTTSFAQEKKEETKDFLDNNKTSNWKAKNLKNPRIKNKKIGRYAAAAIIIILLFIFGRRPAALLINKTISSKNNQSVNGQQVVNSQKIQINKKFTFSGIDDTGKKKNQLEMTITDVEKTDQVIVQEKTYTSKNEKTFLIVNLELKNDTSGRLNIFPGDLIRLVVNDNNQKLFAPDLHNNYVLVAPISTKIDRVGFVIDKSAQDLKLQVGEVEGEKEVISLNF